MAAPRELDLTVTLDAAWQAWSAHLRARVAADDMSPDTMRGYLAYARKAVDHLGPSRTCDSVEAPEIDAWVATYRARQCGPATLRFCHKGIGGLLGYADSQRWIRENPMRDIAKIPLRAAPAGPERAALTKPELAAMIAAARAGHGSRYAIPATCVRDEIVVRLAGESGLRNADIQNLDIQDVGQDAAGNWQVRIRRGKGRKPRTTPLTDACARLVLDWIGDHRPEPGPRPDRYNEHGKLLKGDKDALLLSDNHHRISGSAVGHIVDRVAQVAIGRHFVPHGLRHTTATLLLREAKADRYERAEVPAHLRTMTQLKADRLKPAEGQNPVGLLRVYRRGHGWGEFPLYDPAGAAKMRPLSAKQQRAKEDRRTCPECATVCTYIVYQRCEDCRRRAQQEAQDRQARTCHRCRRESATAWPKDPYHWGACEHCRVHYTIRKQAEEERRALWARTCPGRDCTVQTATDEEIAAERAAGTWRGPHWCPPCEERDERERAERERQRIQAEIDEREARDRQVRHLAGWAAAALADPDTVILDTETTGLEDDARIVDIAVTTVAGEVLLDTLVNPGEPIPPEATDIHGIEDGQVAGAPSFTEILDRLAAALDGKRCLIYNEPYDVARLRHELTVHYRQAGHDDPGAAAAAWLGRVRTEDAMIPYSDWYGDWSDYRGNYAWQPLYGGDHRAASDCRAVVERLREMAAGSAREDNAA